MISNSAPGYTMAYVSRKFTALTTVNPDGFQPLTRQDEITIPVPVMLLFAARTVPLPWLKRFVGFGGKVTLVRHINDAMEALNG